MNANVTVTLLSLGVGALLGGVVQAVVGRYAAFKESKGIAVALGAEISSIVQIVEFRQYLAHLDQLIKTLQSTTHQPTYQDLFSVKIAQDYFTTFNSLCSKMGQLGSLSHQVVLFYTKAKSVIEDTHRLYEMHEQALRGHSTLNRVGLLAQTQELRNLMQNAMETGNLAIQELDTYARRRWFIVFH
jgi:hypothetical protein